MLGRDEQMQPGFFDFQISPRVLGLLVRRLFFRPGSLKKNPLGGISPGL